jgi:hypothetical protein
MLGLTNVYTANLFFGQAQLKPETAKKLQLVVPRLTNEQLQIMQVCVRLYNHLFDRRPSREQEWYCQMPDWGLSRDLGSRR